MNACIFNEPSSKIYKDAKMKKTISSRKTEIEFDKSVLEKKSGEIENCSNNRLQGLSQSLPAITAALKSEDEDHEDSDIDDEIDHVDDLNEKPDNPRWQLYNAVRTYTNPQGICLAEPFLKLPSKQHHSNYYKEIRNPLSLFQIRKKLCNEQYETVGQVAGDLNILFENTKKFNKPDTKFHKDAVKLQKVMRAKVQELLDFQHQKHSICVDGYLLYAKKVRPSVNRNNPNKTPGELSCIVGHEWSKLSQADKNRWEVKAQKMKKEAQQAKIKNGKIAITSPTNTENALFVGPTSSDQVWQCMWNNCDHMFEDLMDFLEHVLNNCRGHVPSTFAQTTSSEAEFQCQWRECPRLKKNSPPFPSLYGLKRHVKEVHILQHVRPALPS